MKSMDAVAGLMGCCDGSGPESSGTVITQEHILAPSRSVGSTEIIDTLDYPNSLPMSTLRPLVIGAFVGLVTITTAQPGQIDAAFAASIQAHGGADLQAFCTAIQQDGRIIVGGAFTHFGGLNANCIARLMPDGSLDTAFINAVGLIGSTVDAMAIAQNGDILIGGTFTSIAGRARVNVAQLHPDGSLDTNFNASTNSRVFALALQQDGAILIGGQFSLVNGTARSRVARLLPSGSLDGGFNAGSVNNTVRGIDVDDSGRVVIGGNFTSVGGNGAVRVAVLAPDGTYDPSFAPSAGPDDLVLSVVVDGYGRIYAAGSFDNVNGSAWPAIVRFNADGSTDQGFNTAPNLTATDGMTHLIAYPDGSALCAGTFSTYGGASSPRIVRIMNDGAPDPSFDPGTGFGGITVSRLAEQPDGAIVAVGSFVSYQGVPQNRITRITGCAPSEFFHDSDGDGYGDPAIVLTTCYPPADYVLDNSDCDDADPLAFPFAPCDDGNSFTHGDHYGAGCTCAGTPASVQVSVHLSGAFDGIMGRDDLYALGVLPTTEPYSAMGYSFIGGGGETMGPMWAGITGPFAPVDWVVVELRSAENPSIVVASQAAILIREGQVLGTDGSPPRFNVMEGDYHVAIKHRNHLGAMSLHPLHFGASTVPVDLTSPAFPTYGANARNNINGTMALWAGDVNSNGTVTYTGQQNDRDPVLVKVGPTSPNNSATGYFTEDTNLDGVVRYTGTGNDRDVILLNIGSTTPNNVRPGQIPPP